MEARQLADAQRFSVRRVANVGQVAGWGLLLRDALSMLFRAMQAIDSSTSGGVRRVLFQ